METTEEFKLILDSLPHVAQKLKLFWGTEYFSEYVNIVMLDTRDGKREGFPKDVAKALATLQKNHEELFPTKVKHDVWEIAHRW